MPSNNSQLMPVVYGLAAAAAFVLVLSVTLGDWPTKIVLGLACLGVLQGLWRGGSELVGIVCGMVIGVILARPLHPMFEPIAGHFGMTGIAGRGLALALAVIVITIVVALAVGIPAKMWMKQRPNWRSADRLAGGGLGLVQGGLLGVVLLWVPMALAPVAQAQPGEPTAASAFVERISTSMDGSFVGGMVQSSNPVGDLQIFGLATRFSEVSRWQPAMQHLLGTSVVAQIRALPSFQEAIDRIKADPKLDGFVNAQGVTNEDIIALLQSDTVLDILDETTVIDDMTRWVTPLQDAIDEAHTLIP